MPLPLTVIICHRLVAEQHLPDLLKMRMTVRVGRELPAVLGAPGGQVWSMAQPRALLLGVSSTPRAGSGFCALRGDDPRRELPTPAPDPQETTLLTRPPPPFLMPGHSVHSWLIFLVYFFLIVVKYTQRGSYQFKHLFVGVQFGGIKCIQSIVQPSSLFP